MRERQKEDEGLPCFLSQSSSHRVLGHSFPMQCGCCGNGAFSPASTTPKMLKFFIANILEPIPTLKLMIFLDLDHIFQTSRFSPQFSVKLEENAVEGKLSAL